MKYVIILPDGAADEPVPELDGRTPLEAAGIANMDWISQHGRIGRAVTVPEGSTPGTDVATLSLFGYDVGKYYSGRAPLEAAARGLSVGPEGIIFRCNFVSVIEGRMEDFTAGHIPQQEADRLISDLNELFADQGLMFYAGVSYRNLMIAEEFGDLELRCSPPHDIPNQPVAEHRPQGAGAQCIEAIMDRATEMIADHEINRVRRDEGRDPVTGIWLWGQGRPTRLPSLRERFGYSGAAIAGVDVIRGIAVRMGMDVIDVPGATGYIDTDYQAKGAAAVQALGKYDVVVVHIEAPDEAGHLGDVNEKVLALERIDQHIVGPLLEAARRHKQWRIMVAPDHPTPVTTRAHSAAPPPWCYAGTGVEPGSHRPFCEKEAESAGLLIDPGHKLMEQFMQPMSAEIRYYSTNRSAPKVMLDEALLQGQAGDRGLYMPDRFPSITPEELASWTDLGYPDIAFNVLSRFTAGVFGEKRLKRLCQDAYDFDVPLESIADRRHLMRLDRGPTASFKDFAARMMARWMGLLVESLPGELVILTATSGDTGSAVAHAYQAVNRIRVVVLFPIDEVSTRQRKQMTTIGANVTTIGIDGKFDDCQAMVKRAFADPDLSAIRLTSANSINIGRLLPQCVYYFYAYVKLARAEAHEPIIFSVPSGNFGNMMGAVIAREMGLPVRRIVVATNANDEVPAFLRTGRYQAISPSRICISNAMNVGHPSNLARLVDVYGGWMDETGTLPEAPDLDRMRRDLYTVSISDDQTRTTIKEVYERFGVLLEPHGAAGWAGLELYLYDNPDAREQLAVCLETADPAKFPDEIKATVGVDPVPPPSLAGLEQLREEYATMSCDYASFRDWLLAGYAPADDD
ncbi:MAG: cofactor-independent phosphoglycerate mutase [Phycisphaerae bacterium]